MTIDEEKQQLRATIRRLSAQLPFRYREAANRAIARHLLALPEYRSAGAVFCFVSAGREIDTRPILDQTLADGKMLCVPLCVADGIMELRAIRNLEELFPGAYGILEPPADSPALSPDQIDLAVIPCVTCSREGRRLGRGGGYYDRFLAHYRVTTTLKSMEETIAALHAAKLDCKIMVGGAVLTPEYAEKIGADWYAKDAKRSADIAKEFFGV